MLRPSDPEYKLTRKIKLGKLTIDEKFMAFAIWINKKYNVEILNIITDTLNGETTRLQLIFEHQKDADTFLLKNRVSPSLRKGKFIAKKYQDLFQDEALESTLVLFYAFEPLAREEAVTSIPLKERDAFKERHSGSLWKVVAFGQYVTFFFYTNEELKKAEQQKQTIAIKEEYYSLVKPFDKFGYFTLENFNAIFDSKENFDQNYDSNWRWYYS
jgi:hypothetical protein